MVIFRVTGAEPPSPRLPLTVPPVAPLARLLLVLSLALSTQGLLVIQGAFLARQGYIAANLCENRLVPESDCHGRCFLEKQSERHRERQERQPADLAQVSVTPALAADAGAVPPPPAPADVPTPAPAEASVYAPGFPAEVFVPPRSA